MHEGIRFDGHVALVTGAGRNLGRAYALELASRGAAVVVNDLRSPSEERSAAEEVVAEIIAAGGEAASLHGSVADPDGAQAVVDGAVDRYGAIDILINNAGIMRNGYIEDLTVEQYDSVLDVNLKGAFLVTRAAWPIMRSRRYGRVIMISSAGGMFSFAGVSNYAAAKAGVFGLCRALAYEGAGHGILVNAVLPMGGRMNSMDVAPPGHAENYPAGLAEALAARRTSESVAPMVVYLASRDCAVSGEAYSAAFGRYARVFAGLTPGWAAEDAAAVTPDDIARELERIRDPDGFTIPRDQYDEVRGVAEALGITTA